MRSSAGVMHASPPTPAICASALAALDARVIIHGTGGETRQVAFIEYHRLPGEHPQRDNRLEPGDLVTSVVVPGNNFAGHSCYLKVRERTSYAFALVSAAAALDVRNGAIVDVRLAMGGVAHKPWRAIEAERLLRGEPPSEALFSAAGGGGDDVGEATSAQPIQGGAGPSPHRARSARCPRWYGRRGLTCRSEKMAAGWPHERADADLKVTGSAKYTADFSVPAMAYAVPRHQQDRQRQDRPLGGDRRRELRRRDQGHHPPQRDSTEQAQGRIRQHRQAAGESRRGVDEYGFAGAAPAIRSGPLLGADRRGSRG